MSTQVVSYPEIKICYDATCSGILISIMKSLKFYLFLSVSVISFYDKDHVLPL